jgi:ATP-dependent Clp protease protease subunit
MPKIGRRSGSMADVVFAGLLGRRTLVLGSEVDDDAASRVISQLLLLGSEDPSADILLYIDSPGGSPAAALAIYDAMNFVPCDVSTWAVGRVSSVASFILSSGARGKRNATNASLISLRSPDLRQHAGTESCNGAMAEIVQLVAQQTGQPDERVALDIRGGFMFSAGEAQAYGLIDAIAETHGGPQGN